MKTSIFWELTKKCNLNCRHCYLGENLSLPSTTADDFISKNAESEYLDFVDKIDSSTIELVTLSGGEPTLNAALLAKIITGLSKKGIIVHLNTNGTLLKSGMLERLSDAGLSSIFYSLDGSSAGKHNYIRGKGKYELLIRSLNEHRKLKDCGVIEIESNIHYVLMKHNTGELDALLSLCDHYKINGLYISKLSWKGNAEKNKDDLGLSDKELFDVTTEILQKYHKLNAAYFLNIKYMKNLFIEWFNKNNKDIAIKTFFDGCSGASNMIFKNSENDLLPCIGISKEYIRPGNVWSTDADLTEKNDTGKAMVSTLFQRFRDTVVNNETYNDYKPCINCKYLRVLCNPCVLPKIQGYSFENGLCLEAYKRLSNA